MRAHSVNAPCFTPWNALAQPPNMIFHSSSDRGR